MENPKAIHLTDDAYWRKLGWAAIARDADGHAHSTCDIRYTEGFNEWLRECFDEGLTVTNLALSPSPKPVASPSPAIFDDAEGRN